MGHGSLPSAPRARWQCSVFSGCKCVRPGGLHGPGQYVGRERWEVSLVGEGSEEPCHTCTCKRIGTLFLTSFQKSSTLVEEYPFLCPLDFWLVNKGHSVSEATPTAMQQSGRPSFPKQCLLLFQCAIRLFIYGYLSCTVKMIF